MILAGCATADAEQNDDAKATTHELTDGYSHELSLAIGGYNRDTSTAVQVMDQYSASILLQCNI